jgi:hypothetical protein
MDNNYIHELLKSHQGEHIPSFGEAEQLLGEFVQSESLQRHCQQVSDVLCYYATTTGKSEQETNLYRVTGLLHDFDYEAHPDEHPYFGIRYLAGENYSKQILEAIAGHALFMDYSRETELSKVLFAADELSGFINAYSLMVGGIESVKSEKVLKKLKDKGFAAKVNREDIYLGFEEIGAEPTEWIDFVVQAMKYGKNS